MGQILPIIGGLMSGHGIKHIINWLSIDGYEMKIKDPSMEFIGMVSFTWAFYSLPMNEAFIFSFIVMDFNVFLSILIDSLVISIDARLFNRSAHSAGPSLTKNVFPK